MRILYINYLNKNSYILTSPLPPLNIREEKREVSSFKKWNIDEALNLIKILNVNVLYQNTVNKILQEIVGKIGNVEIIIPIIDTKPLPNIISVNNDIKLNISPFYIDQYSYFKQYNINKKNSRYIMYQFYHLFSTYIHEITKNPFKETSFNINSKDISDFINKKIDIIPNFKYQKITKYFNNNVKTMFVNNKLIVSSKELLKRLVFMLTLELNYNYDKILNYYKKFYMDNYYIDIEDFDVYPSQVIIYGENSIEKWIHTKTYNNMLYYNVMPELKNSYFLKIKLIDNRIYLAQNMNSLLEALIKAYKWNLEKNCLYETEDIDISLTNIPKFTLFIYECKDVLKKYSVVGYPNKFNIKIIGYKLDNQNKFVVLLQL